MAQTKTDDYFEIRGTGIEVVRTSRYDKGFVFYDDRGAKMTLVKWSDVGQGFGYRWQVKIEWLGVTADGWTDDRWIDLYTGKCFLNERTHQMVYYDSVIITPIKKKP